MMSNNNLHYYISNFNFINLLIGYPLVTTAFIPLLGNSSATSFVTIPFRAFTLFLSIAVILIHFKQKAPLPRGLKIFVLFWILFIIRMFYDLEIQSQFLIPDPYKQRLWLYALGLTLIPMISVIKSIKNIDLKFCRKWTYYFGILFLLFSLFSVVENKSDFERIDANAAFNTISFGLFSVMVAILALYHLFSLSNSFNRKIFHIAVLVLCLYIALRAGSRGPILAFVIVSLFWVSFNNQGFYKGIIKFLFLSGVLFVVQEVLIFLIEKISPLTAKRFIDAKTGEDMSVQERMESYSWFLNEIYSNPIVGSHFARLSTGDFPGYAHNILLDILLGFGLIGLFIFLYIVLKAVRNIYSALKFRYEYWIGLVMLLFLALAFSSGAYYTNPELNISIVITLLLFHTKNVSNEDYNYCQDTSKFH